MRTSLGALAAGMLVTAGCVAGTGLTEPAMSNLDLAREAAARWVPDPQLVSIRGLEPPHVIRNEYYEATIHADAAPGDGRAPAWWYEFVGADGETSSVIVLSGIGVLVEGRTLNASLDLGLIQPIANWTIDSDRAAEVLSADERWAGPAENLTVEWQLAMFRGAPQWNVTAAWEEWPSPRYLARINASTGELWFLAREPDPFVVAEREFERMRENATEPGPFERDRWCDVETGWDHGTVSTLHGLQVAVRLDDDGLALVNATLRDVGAARLVVEHEGSVLYDEFLGLALLGTLSADVVLEDLGEGEVTARIVAEPGAALDATLEVTAMWGPEREGCPPDVD